MHTIVDVENLSPSQRAILAATAANRGKVQVAMRVDAHGWVAVVGRQVFADPHSREVAEEHRVARAEFRDRITATVDVRVEDVSDYELTFADLGTWPPHGSS